MHEHPKLTIAAVNGPAVGAGMALALACDLRIAAASAVLVTGWAGLAFSGDYGGAWFLTRLVGPSRALELLAGNASLDADAARDLGLVNRVVADGEFADAWMAWARDFASGADRCHQRHEGQRARRPGPVVGRGAAAGNRAHGGLGSHGGAPEAVRAWMAARKRNR